MAKISHTVFDRLVYAKLRDVFGGRNQYAVSGGAPLGERLAHFYSGIGITVIEGYGLTETRPPSLRRRHRTPSGSGPSGDRSRD